MRGLIGAISDWPSLYAEVYRCLKPGGWFEHVDFSVDLKSDSGPIPDRSPWNAWQDIFLNAGDRMGKTFRVIDNGANVDWFQTAGFRRLKERRSTVPVGAWHATPKWKTVGKIMEVVLDESIEGCSVYILAHVLGWTIEEAIAFIAETREALLDPLIHVYFEV